MTGTMRYDPKSQETLDLPGVKVIQPTGCVFDILFKIHQTSGNSVSQDKKYCLVCLVLQNQIRSPQEHYQEESFIYHRLGPIRLKKRLI